MMTGPTYFVETYQKGWSNLRVEAVMNHTWPPTLNDAFFRFSVSEENKQQ